MNKMFCFQCQETARNQGCTVQGVCGKTADVANLQDLLVFLCKGISHFSVPLREMGVESAEVNKFITDSLFMTITNANFDKDRFVKRVREALVLRDNIRSLYVSKGGDIEKIKYDGAFWASDDIAAMEEKAAEVPLKMAGCLDISADEGRLLHGLLHKIMESEKECAGSWTK